MAKPFYEEGRYWGKVTRQAMGEAQTGTEQFVLTFLVRGKVNPLEPTGDLIPCAQYERTIFRSITEKTINWLMEDLATLGFTGTSFSHLDPATEGFCDLTGKEMEVYCQHEIDKRDGSSRERWGIANAKSGPPVKALDPKGLRKLDALFGKQLKGLAAQAPAATPKGNGTKSAQKTQPATEAPETAAEKAQTDEIPF